MGSKSSWDPIYLARWKSLQSLGFPDYDSYLASDLWKKIRRRMFGTKEKKCAVCGRTASEIHHLNYKRNTLLGKDLSALVLICRQCHISIEFDSEGNKRSGVKARSVEQRVLAKWFRERARRKRKADILKPKEKRRIAVLAEERERERWTQIRIDKGLRKAGEY